jgi:hypothetical protein
MTKKWIGINLLLFIVAAIAAYQLYDSIQQFETNNDISKIGPAETGSQEPLLPPPPKIERYSPMEFAEISDKNVFSETRTKGESSEATTAATGTLPAAQKPTLVGVIISDKQKVATLQEPRTGGRTGQVLLKKVGDTYQGYTITGIETDHIVLDNGIQKATLALNDTSQPAPNRKTVTVPTRVVPFGNTAATATASAAIVVGQTLPTRSIPGRTTPQTANTPTDNINQNFIVPVPGGQTGRQTTQAETPAAAQATTQQPATQQPAANTANPNGGTRIIRTPFGEILRNR